MEADPECPGPHRRGPCPNGGTRRAAFTAATCRPKLAGVTVFHGPGIAAGPHAVLDRATRIDAPLPPHTGEQDRTIPAEHVAAIDAALTGAGAAFEQHTYPGAEHAFACDARPDKYAPDAATTAWRRRGRDTVPHRPRPHRPRRSFQSRPRHAGSSVYSVTDRADRARPVRPRRGPPQAGHPFLRRRAVRHGNRDKPALIHAFRARRANPTPRCPRRTGPNVVRRLRALITNDPAVVAKPSRIATHNRHMRDSGDASMPGRPHRRPGIAPPTRPPMRPGRPCNSTHDPRSTAMFSARRQ
ncbi:dienelactone hydrolase family protein [Embleya sp. MST-111070]|uniref:dienelactone hydrolase family protein n=1 Tax=Embleya sp. MST-111070 TaxID=3398231 RepID=UPI003F7395E9